MNVTIFTQMDYENIANWTLGENKPNTNPIQTQTNPIAERVKLMQSVYLQRIMKKNAAKGYEKTNPIQTQFPQSQKRTQTLLQQRIMKMKPPSGSEKQTQTNPILKAMFVSFCAAGYYRRVVLVPLNEHIDIIYQRFSASDVVIILNL